MPVRYNCTLKSRSDQIAEEDYTHVKTSMILIEASDIKEPPVETLGVKSEKSKCVLNLIENPF